MASAINVTLQAFRSAPPKADWYKIFSGVVGKKENPFCCLKVLKLCSEAVAMSSFAPKIGSDRIYRFTTFCKAGMDGTLAPKFLATVQEVRVATNKVLNSPSNLHFWKFVRESLEFIADIVVMGIIATGAIQLVAVSAALGLIMDIMDTKDATESLEKSQSRLSSIVWSKKSIVPKEALRYEMLNIVKRIFSLASSIIAVLAIFYGIKFNVVLLLSIGLISTSLSLIKNVYKEGMTHNLYINA